MGEDGDWLWNELYLQALLDDDETEQRASFGFWETAEGEDIHISDMTTLHLINALRYIRREGDAFLIGLYEDQFKLELNKRGFDTSFL